MYSERPWSHESESSRFRPFTKLSNLKVDWDTILINSFTVLPTFNGLSMIICEASIVLISSLIFVCVFKNGIELLQPTVKIVLMYLIIQSNSAAQLLQTPDTSASLDAEVILKRSSDFSKRESPTETLKMTC